jgi:hypothetical protein
MPSRHRIKGNRYSAKPGFCETDSISQMNGFPKFWPAIPEMYLEGSSISEMYDEIYDFADWNPCDHLRITQKGQGRDLACPQYPDRAHLFCRTRYSEYREYATRALTSVLNSDYTNWLAGVMSKGEHQFPAEANLAVSLFELRRGIREILPTMQDLRQNAGGNFLKIKFGIEPFLKDLKDSLQVWSKFKSRLSFLKETRGQTFYQRKKKSTEGIPDNITYIAPDWEFFPVPYTPTSGGGGGGGGPGGGGTGADPAFVPHECSQKYECMWCTANHYATGLISNEIGDMDNLVKQADAFGRVVGFGNSPKILWNILPWSWLFDWFVDTDRILDRFEDAGPFDGKLALNGFWVTTKWRSGGLLKTAHRYCVGGSYVEMGNFLIRNYLRSSDQTAENVDSSLIQPSLDGDQRQILLALLIQRSKQVPDWISLSRKLRKLI